MELKEGYKQTEVGVIPEDWEVVCVDFLKSKIGSALSTGPFGSSISSRFFKDSGVPVIRGSNLASDGRTHLRESGYVFVSEKKASEFSRSTVRSGDIIFTCWGTIDQIGLITSDAAYPRYIISNKQMKFTADPQKAASRFLFYLFSAQQFKKQIEEKSIGSSVPGFNLTMLRSIHFCAPELKEQEAIAEALSDVDALIESIEQLIEKKRQIKEGAMQQLLTGKRRLPGFERKAGYKQTEVGVIPGDWGVSNFSAVFTRVTTKKFQICASKYQSSGSLPIVDQGNKPIVGYSDELDKKFVCPKSGVIVFGDHTCIIKFIDFDFLIGADGVQIVQTIGDNNTRYFAHQLTYRKIQSTGYNRHFGRLKEQLQIVPSTKAEQEAIAEVLSDMDAEIDALESKLAKAHQLKSGMMYNLLTGKIRLV
ncbi:restriction endonuclease subunit S [Verrucomicrobia bacterium]|nr:restriction endonuclease subunit S [Verrucomicrobiota bacterium]